MLETEKSQELYHAAVALLARREYSKGELEERLLKKTDAYHEVEAVVERLSEQGLQSDERFCESFVRYRIEQGKGPLKIRQDLKFKKISEELISLHLDIARELWFERAVSVLLRKFPALPQESGQLEAKEKAKCLRFLLSRGFSSDIAYDALNKVFMSSQA
ncbi:regulatory protein RecX [Agaribacterium sp. ZY112]|uniref:regulatory protein RecX n=1 Tax=Agaribacterium sp. ZY112 TaxID=3233574 RepID=UPI0035263C8B